MSKTLKIVHSCDHILVEKSFERKTVSITRSLTDNYDPITSFTIATLGNVKYNDTLRFPNVHFEQYTPTRIKWICDPSQIPTAGEQYTIDFEEQKIIKTGHSAEACPRCGGSGWYVSPVSFDDRSISTVEGVDKLVQDFMKILLTDSRYYAPGTTLRSILGITEGSDEIEDMITIAVKEAEDKLLNIQYEMTLLGTEISEDELLRAAVIEDIGGVENSDQYYVKIRLINQTKFGVSIGLAV